MHALRHNQEFQKSIQRNHKDIVILKLDTPKVDWALVMQELRLALRINSDILDLQRYLTEAHLDKDLRARLIYKVPELQSICTLLNDATSRSTHVLQFNSLGLKGMSAHEQAACFAILSLLIGEPLAADKPTGEVVWDVKSRSEKNAVYATFSEGLEEAVFHTDTAFYPIPVKYFGLYCRTPASCGGGVNRLCNADALQRRLANDPLYAWIPELLTNQPGVFRVPGAFTENNGIETVVAKVFAEDILVRLRRDSLAKGLELSQRPDSERLLAAVDAFLALAHEPDNHIELRLEEDAALFINNHELIHYRSSFQDPQRHLMRVWIRH